MGATAIALPCLGAMAHWQATLHRAAPARDRPVARRHYHGGGAPARPLAAQSAPRPPSRSVQRLLRRQRSSHSGPGRHRTAVYGPVRTVVGEGWSCEASPYPDRLGAGKTKTWIRGTSPRKTTENRLLRIPDKFSVQEFPRTALRNAGPGLLDVQPQSPSPAPRERVPSGSEAGEGIR